MTGDSSDLMTPGEVAQALRLNPRTITRWDADGKLTSIRTPSGHRRYFRAQVDAISQGEPLSEQQVKELRDRWMR